MRIFFIIIFGLFSIWANATYLGAPVIKTFAPDDYKGGSRIYALAGNNRGLLFAGDKSGILVFDGEDWSKVDCGFAITSLAYSNDEAVYFTGLNGIGRIVSDSVGAFRMEMLNHLISSDNSFRNLRNAKVFNVEGRTIFVINNLILINSSDQLRIIESPYHFQYFQVLNHKLFLYSSESGLFKFEGNKLNLITSSKFILNKDIRGIMGDEENLKLLINDAGYFNLLNDEIKPLVTELDEFSKDHELSGSIQIDSNTYSINTYYHGMFMVDGEGNILQHYSYDNGLSNNTVFHSFIDNWNNLWVATGLGISIIRREFPFTIFNTREGIGTGYDAILFNSELYLATSQGLFRQIVEDKTTFKFEKIFNGHVWGLKIIENKLYFGHGSGLFVFEEGEYNKVLSVPCGWNMKKWPESENIYITSTPGGLLKLTFNEGEIKSARLIKGFNQYTQNFEFDTDGTIWSESKQSMFQIKLNEELDSAIWVKPFDRVEAGNSLKHVVSLNGIPRFVADKGIYQYRSESNIFVPDAVLAQLGTPDNIITDPFGNVWTFEDGKMLLYALKDGKFKTGTKRVFSFIDGSYPVGLENIHYLDNGYVIIGAEDGFWGYQKDARFMGAYSSVSFRSIVLSNRSGKSKNIWGTEAYLEKSQKIIIEDPIDYSRNSIKFKFSAGSSNYDRIQYQTHLNGYDKNWSEWSSENTREFTNLPPGDYLFAIQALNRSNEYSFVASCEFVINPPWYLTTWAKVGYVFGVILFIVLVNFAYRIRIKTMLKKREEAQYRKEQEQIRDNLKKEKEIIKLKNEKLKNEVVYQSKDLANSTMSIIQKNQFLIELKDDLEVMKGYSEQNKLVTEDIRRMIRKINKGIDNEENWHVFEDYFDHVHENFIKKMKKKYPTLTSKDLRMCAYIRMNLTSKEIAPLLNITVRGVEISRYRLRKKLDLGRDDNLNDFLVKV